jgi:mannose-6-phosphate isomerase-like protein (cupin superfamily)
LFTRQSNGASYRQRFLHRDAGLQFLDAGEYRLGPGQRYVETALPRRESLFFQWRGTGVVSIEGQEYPLENYDTLYVPRGAAFSIRNDGTEPAVLIQTSAPAEHTHPPFHSPFREFSKDESRIRHLKGKDVYLMFDVTEGADKLVAGYTFFEPHARSWPPHNHTDQEEVYIFIQGKGAMEVYESPETLTFVHSVEEGDMVTIPFLNYHPVFSQADPLQFIWCIAGERYWVGDKNKTFMIGTDGLITT